MHPVSFYLKFQISNFKFQIQERPLSTLAQATAFRPSANHDLRFAPQAISHSCFAANRSAITNRRRPLQVGKAYLNNDEKAMSLRAAHISELLNMQPGRKIKAVFCGQGAEPWGAFGELFAAAGLRHEPHHAGVNAFKI